MIEIDGSAGGGQLLRSALGLSAVSQTPVRIGGIRENRPEPGLGPQHVAAAGLLADVCDAAVEGLEVGGDELAFDPGPARGGRYAVDVGTAGSLTLVLDALLPVVTALDEPLSVTATGGTDVKWSPPIDAHRTVKYPLLRRFGLQAALDLERRGFYPVGGGRATLTLGPSRLDPIDVPAMGALEGARIYSTASTDLADAAVADRQASAAQERLEGAGVEILDRTVTRAASVSTGSVIVVRLDHGRGLAGFDALGERGRPAERVGAAAADAAIDFLDTDAGVDAHLADQLVVPLALAGGAVSIPYLTDHVSTSLDLIGRFDREVEVDRSGSAPVVRAP